MISLRRSFWQTGSNRSPDDEGVKMNKMKLVVGRKYFTKCGNKVACLHKFGDGTYLGQYEKTIEGHETLKGLNQMWRENGDWNKFPGGIHDIVKSA